MKVKIFDENHERDLENDIEIVDIQFRTAVSIFSSEQVYCFSAMILYK